MTRRGIRAVLFDFDGTLAADEHPFEVVDRIGRLLAEQVHVDPTALLEANRSAWARRWPELGDRWMLGQVPGDAVAAAVWSDALTALGVADHSAVHAAVQEQLRVEADRSALYPEARGVLDDLRARGLPLALVTNGASALQRKKLHRTGIETLFDVILISSEVGVMKPDAAIFDAGLHGLGVPAAAGLMVGDNLTADVGGARRAGLTGVWVNRQGAAVGPDPRDTPDAIITDLDGLSALL